MGFIRDLYVEFSHYSKNPLAGTPDLDNLRELAYDRTWQEAERLNTYYSWAMANLDLYSAYEPDPDELAEYIAANERGDWRKLKTIAATVATDLALRAQVEADVSKLEEAIAEAQDEGFAITGIHAESLHGWAAHQCETSWATGTLYLWKRLDGGPDAQLLRVDLSDGSQLWLDLNPSPAE